MNKEIGKLWVEALRSEEYKQGRNALKSGDSFCCLGVLCDIAAKNGLGTWGPSPHKGSDIFCDHTGIKEAAYLPLGTRDWADIQTAVGKFGDASSDVLHILNDCGVPFKEIADVIELNMELL
jgi:hypothetical protein